MPDLDLARAHDIGDAARRAAERPPFGDIERKAASYRRRHLAGVGAVAGVAAIMLGIGFTAVARPPLLGSPPVAGPDTTDSSRAGVVPWVALPPSSPDVAIHTAAPSPDGVDVGQVPMCRPNQLSASAPSLDGAGGQWVLEVNLSTTPGQAPCRISGTATLAFSHKGDPVPVRQTTGTGTMATTEPVVLDKNRLATLRASWSATACPNGSESADATLTLPAGGTPVVVGALGASPSCVGGTPSDNPTVTVWPFQSLRDPAEPRQRSDYAGMQVRIADLVHARAGRVAKYTVTLVAARDISLATCPDYTMTIVAGSDTGAGSLKPQTVTHGLNCAGVRQKGADGARELPAGTPVRFAMETAVPGDWSRTRTAKLTWRLLVPDPGIGAEAAATIN